MISPIENNGMIARTQDYANYRQQDDVRASGAQVRLQDQIDEHENANVKTVHHSDDSDGADTHHDAREQGKNKYYNNRIIKKEKQPESDGSVIVKKTSGFDFRI